MEKRGDGDPIKPARELNEKYTKPFLAAVPQVVQEIQDGPEFISGLLQASLNKDIVIQARRLISPVLLGYARAGIVSGEQVKAWIEQANQNSGFTLPGEITEIDCVVKFFGEEAWFVHLFRGKTLDKSDHRSPGKKVLQVIEPLIVLLQDKPELLKELIRDTLNLNSQEDPWLATTLLEGSYARSIKDAEAVSDENKALMRTGFNQGLREEPGWALGRLDYIIEMYGEESPEVANLLKIIATGISDGLIDLKSWLNPYITSRTHANSVNKLRKNYRQLLRLGNIAGMEDASGLPKIEYPEATYPRGS